MIESLTVINYRGDELELKLRNPEESGFLVANVTGLTPPQASLSLAEFATHDGSLLANAKVTRRDIGMQIIFYDSPPYPGIENLRHTFYRFFPLMKPITLIVKNDSGEYFTEGYVESNQIEIWSDLEGASVNIVCTDPYFYEEGSRIGSLLLKDPLFEFPFYCAPDNGHMIEFSRLKTVPTTTIVYDGDASTGLIIHIHARGSVGDVTIQNRDTNGTFVVSSSKIGNKTGAAIGKGDDVIIDTVFGEKSVTLIRGGVKTNILNCIDSDPEWFELEQGENTFAYTSTDRVDLLDITFEYYNKFAGV